MATSSWFTTHRRHSVTDTPTKPSYDASTSGSQANDGKGAVARRPSVQRAITAPLSTPHDAVLTEFTGVQRDVDQDAARHHSEAPSSAVPLNRDVSISGGPAEDASAQETGTAQAQRSTATTPNPGPLSGVEHVYDPFTGSIAGVLYPRSNEPAPTVDTDPGSSRKKDSLQFDQAKDELWTHLARIRDLQSEIAGMHVHMEGIGLGDGGRQKRPPGPTSRMHTDTIGAGDEWVDAEQEANARKKAKDAEFTKLAESFEGRRAAMDGIMDKLDDLSRALTTFHALPTPQIDMLSRSNTKDSLTTSPLLRSPSPMFTNPASSPPPGSPPSMSPTSPPPDFGRRAKSMSRNMGMVRTDFGVRSETLSPMSESPVSDIDGRL